MHYSAKILRLNEDVEEEVVLVINGLELVCFVNMLPHGAKEGQSYQVELIPMVFNEYSVHELNGDVLPSIIQVNNSFSYIAVGKLSGNRLNAGGVVFEDDFLLSDFGHLEGKIISWKVDRIDVEFL